MRSVLNPKWLLLLNSLPVAVLLLLLAGKFSVIHPLLNAESRQAWRTVGAGLLALGGLHAAYALWCLWRRQSLPTAYGVLALLLNLGGMFYYFSAEAQLLFPPEVPRWMVGSEAELYAFTFLMPTVAHAVLLLVVRSVPADRPVAALPSFGLALAVPLGAFVLGLLLDALPIQFGPVGQSVLSTGAFMLAPLTFLFFLARGLYVVVSRKAGLWHEHQLIWKLLIAGVLPLLGLAVNAGLSRPGVFGDFRSPWFYVLAALNALLLCLPAPAGRAGRLALLWGRSATLSYTLYFFVVFLPFLPLSVLAIILIGTGFLLLAPLLLLLVHAQVLDEDFARLRGAFPRWVPTAAVVAGLLVLPLVLTARYAHNRRTLHAALAYVYAPDYAQPPQPLDADALLTTLAAVRAHKSGDGEWFGRGQPYLSTYFNWLVLDNLTLSDDKLARLERIFGDEAVPAEADSWAAWRAADAPPGGPRLTRVQQRSRYDPAQGAWVSWVDLEITAPDSVQSWRLPQYAAELALPPGCWVQDYYLDIAGRREHGILAEKKAAAWVYAQILNEGRNRDPGILHYLRDNRLGLRVFPFAAREVRRTGLCLLHKEPVQLQLDGRTLTLGDSAQQPAVGEVATAGREVVYVSRAAKQRLPRVQRRPYYHFLLDASAGTQGRRAAYRRAVQALLARQPLPGPPRFTLVNAYARPLPAGADWQQALADAPATGGLYLAGALRQTLVQAQQQPGASYPVLVVVTDSAARAVLDVDFADLAAAYPESPAYYVLPTRGPLEARSLRQEPARPWSAAPAPGAPVPVRAWPTAARARAYLPDDHQPSIVLNASAVPMPAAEPRWLTGLRLQGYQQHLALQPAAAEATRLPAIQASFRSGILTPLTAYLSLENDAQKAALRRKQQEVLSAHAALDAGEDTPPTAVPLDDEAALLLLAGAMLAWWQLRRRRAVA